MSIMPKNIKDIVGRKIDSDLRTIFVLRPKASERCNDDIVIMFRVPISHVITTTARYVWNY